MIPTTTVKSDNTFIFLQIFHSTTFQYKFFSEAMPHAYTYKWFIKQILQGMFYPNVQASI